MALVEDIATVKDLAAVPLGSLPALTDEAVGGLIDLKGLNLAVSYLWTRYAATLTGLVDVSESGSSRKLGDLLKNALSMSKSYSVAAAEELVVTNSRPRTRAIVRP